MPVVLPRKLWLLVIAVGVFITIVFALVPVGTRFGDDPLLRLRQLDPELSPPDTTAVCGSPLVNLGTRDDGASLYEAARNSACHDAVRRRLGVAVAAGAVLVMIGLIGLMGQKVEWSLPTDRGLPQPVR
ncbi:MAG: hypothetical protein LC733_05430 [Actinobacteria bacterium]|nr:hypothetical protein [Actinomycetota bacterium]